MNATALPRIGFIGLGNMGGPMCHRLIDAGLPVKAYDINKDALKSVADAGAVAGESATDCTIDVDLLLTSLPRPDHVVSVMRDGNVLEALPGGSIWVDLTTNRPELLRELATATPANVDIIDAPVTGAVDGARTGKLTLFVGGDSGPVSRVTPTLSNLGTVIPCGPLGSGNIVKLVTNQLWFIHAAALAEGFAVGMANEIDLETLWGAIKNSVADSFVAHHDAPSIFAGHYDPSFTLDLCLKDLGLIAELSKSVGASLPMTEAADAAFRRAADRYGTAAGELHVAKRIEDDAGISMQLDGDWKPHWEK